MAISRAHECVEFSLKSALLTVLGRYPHTHDVGSDLVGAISKFPDWLKKKVPCFALRSKIMSMLRDYSNYGYEVTKTPAKELFGDQTQGCASKTLRKFSMIAKGCSRRLNIKSPKHMPMHVFP